MAVEKLEKAGRVTELCISPSLDLESVATVYPDDGFRRVQRFSHQRMGKAGIWERATHAWDLRTTSPWSELETAKNF
jgi:hypothetical protein